MTFIPKNMMRVIWAMQKGHFIRKHAKLSLLPTKLFKISAVENMKLEISGNRPVGEIQNDFNRQYPFLKLDFYKTQTRSQAIQVKERLPHSALLKIAGLKKAGHIDINKDMSVGELENIFLDQFGLVVQVSRNLGGIWLGTTMTDNWSLSKQNEYGKEIISYNNRNFL